MANDDSEPNHTPEVNLLGVYYLQDKAKGNEKTSNTGLAAELIHSMRKSYQIRGEDLDKNSVRSAERVATEEKGDKDDSLGYLSA